MNGIIIYRACMHSIPTTLFPARAIQQEIEKAAKGDVCPKCRAEASQVISTPDEISSNKAKEAK